MAKLLNGTNIRDLQANREKLDMLELDKNVTARQQISVYAILIKKFACSYPHIWKVGVHFFFARSAHESRFVPIFKIAAPLLAGTI